MSTRRLRWAHGAIVGAFTALCGTAALSGMAAAQVARDASRETAPESANQLAPLRFQLKNGLKVVLSRQPLFSRVTVVVAYGSGQADIPPDYRGLPHLVEHLTFHGTRHLKPLEMFRRLDEVGAGYNAYTAPDRTVYFAALPPRALPLALWLESERMAFALDGIDERALEIEKKVVENELEERDSLPFVLWAERQREIYGRDHPLAPSAKESSNIKRASLANVQWFFQSSHRPDNATLVISGNFDLEQARALVERYFGPIVNPAVTRSSVAYASPKLCGRHRLYLEHPYLFGNYLEFNWVLRSDSTPEARVGLAAMAHLLEEEMDRQFVRSQPIAKSASVDIEHYENHSLLTFGLWLDSDQDRVYLEALVTQLVHEFRTRRIGDGEAQLLRDELRTTEAMGGEYDVSFALQLAEGRDPTRESNAARSLQPRQIEQAIRAIPDERFVLYAEPTKLSSFGLVRMDTRNPCR